MRVNRSHTALVLVDLQIDFLPGGALTVSDDDAVIPLRDETGYVLTRFRPA